MARKSPSEERRIILARDHRRRYGVRVAFRVLHAQHIGTLSNVTLLFPDGSFGRIRQEGTTSWELGVPHELQLEAFPTAAEAEEAGMRAAQALLLTAINLNFGLRLEYSNHQPPTVYDRTVSSGMAIAGMAVVSWPEPVIVEQLSHAFEESIRDRRILLSMELLASSTLEANDRARFVMAVSALEPLAASGPLGPNVDNFVKRAVTDLRSDIGIPSELRQSLEGRLTQLKKESVRQALSRLCANWFPGSTEAREYIDYVYGLRSEILHNGAVSDLDILLAQETVKVRQYIRRIYEQEFRASFKSSTAV